MSFCATCGAQVEGRFCAKCGSPVAVASSGAGAPPPPPPGQGYAPPPGQGYPPPSGYPPQAGYAPPAAAAPMADNMAGALCYVLGFITGIIFLVIAPYSQNRAVRFHAFQSIFLSLACIAIRVVFGSLILGNVLFTGYHFGILWMLYGLFWMVFGLGCLLLWIVLIVQTYQGKTIVLPVIGPLAQKQA